MQDPSAVAGLGQSFPRSIFRRPLGCWSVCFWTPSLQFWTQASCCFCSAPHILPRARRPCRSEDSTSVRREAYESIVDWRIPMELRDSFRKDSISLITEEREGSSYSESSSPPCGRRLATMLASAVFRGWRPLSARSWRELPFPVILWILLTEIGPWRRAKE